MKPKCPECGSDKIKNAMKEVMCKNCGLILEDVMFSAG